MLTISESILSISIAFPFAIILPAIDGATVGDLFTAANVERAPPAEEGPSHMKFWSLVGLYIVFSGLSSNTSFFGTFGSTISEVIWLWFRHASVGFDTLAGDG